ncbi:MULTISPECIES: type I-F CRISPR-associated protein Csy2 [Providencia]|uniref:CRISPR type I-F/YPEST-associated protein Csy2 n=1 Tax=Providencia rustigianii TaxID=158850 RepID=A0A379G2L9_9GAMM|nr:MULTISPECIES: type I-F CRISPR-associated protein Csy2 [Providencia]MTC57092.1 type I-F CRISPR-associated protein Csy2 [Providencia rustigianii]SUC35156.1 CRISPR type I-F/YPEST-associated protein Csy2 [Providencia rustigianii]
MSSIYIIKLPYLKIHNANALSSPYTIGFPAMTAWLGFMHALERKLHEYGVNIVLDSVAVISHECDLQTYRGPNDFVSSIIGTANPLNSDGTRSAFIEEARCHLEASLLIKYAVDDDGKVEPLLENSPVLAVIYDLVMTMKLAGGDILSLGKPTTYIIPEKDTDGVFRRNLLNSVMPGYALIERRDLMKVAMNKGQDAMDALLDYVVVDNQCIEKIPTNEHGNEKNAQFEWRAQRKISGWIVPIATGYQGISPLGQAKNQRDPDTPHRFAESVVTLGEFILANRANSIYEILWGFEFIESQNLYLCQQLVSNFISAESK